jgi:Na+/melibiose symporter-like transporter
MLGLSALFFAIYFVQGVSEPTEGLIAQPTRSLLLSWGNSASLVALFHALLALPWALKPLYGILTDLVPLRGSRRRSYLLLANAGAGVALMSLFLWPPTPSTSLGALWLPLVIATLGVAFVDVVADALMIEKGQPCGLTGRLQSIQWFAMYFATCLTGLLGGWLSGTRNQAWGFGISGACVLFSLWITWQFVREPPAAIRPPASSAEWRNAFRHLYQDIKRGPILLMAVFLFLWSFNPFAAAVQYVYMTRHLQFSEEFCGQLVTIEAVGAMLGSLLYAMYCRRLSVRWLIHLSIVSGIATTLAHWALVGPHSGRAIAFATGFAYLTGSLVQLDLAARVCTRAAAGTTFALLMALSNIAISVSTALGGWLFDEWSIYFDGHVAYELLVFTGALATAVCWYLVPGLVRAAEPVEAA